VTVPSWTPSELREHLAGDRPVLVDWRADWCTNCAAQEKVLERLAPELESTVLVGMLDVGAYPDVAEEFGVQSLPTLAVFVDGRAVQTLHGYRRAPEIRDTIHRALSPPGAAAEESGADDGQA
jgi:thioredoxin-like negative regulator of GroEL